MKVTLAAVLLWLGASSFIFDHASADLEKTCTSEDYYQPPRGLCGPKLSNILALLCPNGYNKRSQDHSYFPLQTSDLLDVGGSSSKVVGADGGGGATGDLPSERSRLSRQTDFLPKASALAFLHDKRSVYMSDGSITRGIVCECCVNQCTVTEFRQYCAQTPK